VAVEESLEKKLFSESAIRAHGELLVAVLILLFGLAGFYFALDLSSDSYSSPSVFPKFVSAIIALCGCVLTAQVIRKERPPKEISAITFILPLDVAVMLALLGIYCLLLPTIHFIPSTFLFLTCGITYLRRGKKIPQTLIIAAVSLLVLVGIFRYVFLVILP
jgi:Predicted membrane protein